MPEPKRAVYMVHFNVDTAIVTVMPMDVFDAKGGFTDDWGKEYNAFVSTSADNAALEFTEMITNASGRIIERETN